MSEQHPGFGRVRRTGARDHSSAGPVDRALIDDITLQGIDIELLDLHDSIEELLLHQIKV